MAEGRDMCQAGVNKVMNTQGNFLTSYGPVGFSSRTLPRGVS